VRSRRRRSSRITCALPRDRSALDGREFAVILTPAWQSEALRETSPSSSCAPSRSRQRSTQEKRTVQVVWTTGARVKRGYFEPYYEELSLDPKHVRMDRLSSGNAPLLNTHRATT
jgi:hypothetical protein